MSSATSEAYAAMCAQTWRCVDAREAMQRAGHRPEYVATYREERAKLQELREVWLNLRKDKTT